VRSVPVAQYITVATPTPVAQISFLLVL